MRARAHTHTHTHTRTHIHTRTHTRTHIHTHTRTDIHTHTRTHARTHPRTHAQTYTHARTPARTHARTQTHTHEIEWMEITGQEECSFTQQCSRIVRSVVGHTRTNGTMEKYKQPICLIFFTPTLHSDNCHPHPTPAPLSSLVRTQNHLAKDRFLTLTLLIGRFP